MNTAAIENDKLKSFIAAVNSQIDDKVSQLLKDADDERRRILSRAESDSKVSADRHFANCYKKNGNQFVRDISKAELEMKKDVLRHREMLTDEVFAVVESKIAEYRQTPKYIDYLVKTLFIMNISSETEVYLSAEDMKHTEILKKAIKFEDVTFTKDDNIRLGGLSVYNKQKGTITDKTFDLALEEQRQLFTNSNAFAQ